MTHNRLSFILGIAAMVLITCRPDAPQAAAQAPAAGAANGASSDGAIAGHAITTGVSGKVVETMDAGQYTYVLVDDGAKKVWAAAPHFAVAVGDKVVVPEGMPMRNFESKTLNRTFDLVYFVPSVQVVGAKGGQAPAAAAEQGASPHGMSSHPATGAAKVDLSNIKKADGGQTVADLFAKKAALAGKDVAVRGRVVKYVPSVMGKNWIHVQDGTGASGTNDLTVSTSGNAAVGDLVLVRGKLSTDKDLGFGYKNDIHIEDAAVKVE